MSDDQFGPAGEMDEDGFSTRYSYAEKAAIERNQLSTLEQKIAEAKAAGDHDVVVSTGAYADDVRARVARFEELAARDAARPDSDP
jgi:hypothetical protein